MVKHNISKIVKNGLCMGCGICENACKVGAIQMELKWDSHKPIVDNNKCLADKGCNRCLSCCPGQGIDLGGYSKELFPGLNEEYGLGKYVALYTGFSCDSDIRFHSASGGMVTGFLIYLLDKGIIEGAVVTSFREDKPFRAQSIVARSREEIIQARSSKYCPVSLDGVYDQIFSSKGMFVIVGLPCHIHGFRKLATKDRVFASKIFGYFGLYCSSTRTALMPEYLLSKYDVDPVDIDSFAFRDEGYPGYLKIVKRDGSVHKVHFHEYYRKIRAFFNLRRCLLCFDESAELADVAFGDIHIPEFLQDDLGINSVIVRNAEFDKLLKKACCDDYVSISPVEKEKVFRSQNKMIYMKKKRIYAAFLLRKMLFRKVPDFGQAFKGKAKLKDIISVCAGYFQGFVGKRKRIWFLINSLQRIIHKIKR